MSHLKNYIMFNNNSDATPLSSNGIISEIEVSYSMGKSFGNLVITSSEDAYAILRECYNKKTIELREEFRILLLNRANKVIGVNLLSTGTTTGTVVDIKLLAAIAIKTNSSGVIVCHNHPSGNLKPSHVDRQVTERIIKALQLFEIKLIDHVIISLEGYYSFADDGLI